MARLVRAIQDLQGRVGEPAAPPAVSPAKTEILDPRTSRGDDGQKNYDPGGAWPMVPQKSAVLLTQPKNFSTL